MPGILSERRSTAEGRRRVENSPDAGAPSPAAVIIIGGGMGGLSAAIYLRLAGYEVTIYEANEREKERKPDQ